MKKFTNYEMKYINKNFIRASLQGKNIYMMNINTKYTTNTI